MMDEQRKTGFKTPLKFLSITRSSNSDSKLVLPKIVDKPVSRRLLSSPLAMSSKGNNSNGGLESKDDIDQVKLRNSRVTTPVRPMSVCTPPTSTDQRYPLLLSVPGQQSPVSRDENSNIEEVAKAEGQGQNVLQSEERLPGDVTEFKFLSPPTNYGCANDFLSLEKRHDNDVLAQNIAAQENRSGKTILTQPKTDSVSKMPEKPIFYGVLPVCSQEKAISLHPKRDITHVSSAETEVNCNSPTCLNNEFSDISDKRGKSNLAQSVSLRKTLNDTSDFAPLTKSSSLTALKQISDSDSGFVLSPRTRNMLTEPETIKDDTAVKTRSKVSLMSRSKKLRNKVRSLLLENDKSLFHSKEDFIESEHNESVDNDFSVTSYEKGSYHSTPTGNTYEHLYWKQNPSTSSEGQLDKEPTISELKPSLSTDLLKIGHTNENTKPLSIDNAKNILTLTKEVEQGQCQSSSLSLNCKDNSTSALTLNDGNSIKEIFTSNLNDTENKAQGLTLSLNETKNKEQRLTLNLNKIEPLSPNDSSLTSPTKHQQGPEDEPLSPLDTLLTSPRRPPRRRISSKRKYFNPKTLEEDEFIGFASLPDQVHRKAVRRGFDFSLMVLGDSGLGKSTLINSLFLTDLYKERKIPDSIDLVERTLTTEKKQLEIEEKGVKVRLTIVDTPGYNDAVNADDSWRKVVEYVDQQFQLYYQAESGLNRKNIQDTRIHCCLYFISPYGHGLKPLDILVMKKLHNKVNIVPLIAKADVLTPKEVKRIKTRVLEDIRNNEINIYTFPDCDSDEDEEFKEQDKALKNAVPFAVIGSNTVVEAGGKKIRGRMYPWGIVEVDNPKHCDFIKLRQMLISTHMQDLKDITSEIHYENYRAEHLLSNEVAKTNRERTKLKRDSMINIDKAMETEQLLQEKEAEIQRMQEMLAKMQAQLQNNTNPQMNGRLGNVR